MSAESKRNIVDGKAVAYIVAPTEDLKSSQVVIVREGEQGYRPVSDYQPSTKERIEAIVKGLNDRLGVTKEEAFLIALSTMGKKRRAG